MKTSLSVIKSHSIGIIDESIISEENEYAEIIVEEVELLNQMVISLLRLSELESGLKKINYEYFDLVELVETVAGRLLIDFYQGDYNFTYNLPDNKLIIFADIKMLEIVLFQIFIKFIFNFF